MERKLNLGVIGLGGRAASLLGVFRRVHSDLRVAAVADPDRDGARRRLRGAEMPERDTAFFMDADGLLDILVPESRSGAVDILDPPVTLIDL